MSKRFIIGKTGIAVFLAGIAVLFFCPGIAAAACNATADDGCPLKINNQLVFDRCFGAPPVGPAAGKRTAVGNQICDILRDTNQISRKLGAGAASLQQNAQKDLKAFAEVTFNDAVDRKALEKFDATNGMLGRIEADIEAYKNDKFCGSKAAMEAAKKSFEADIRDLRIFGEGITGTAEATTAMLPVAAETGNIVTEVGKLRAMSYNRGGSAVNSFNQVNAAAMSLQTAANGMKLSDLNASINAGTDVVMSNLPFITDCAACAAAIVVVTVNIVNISAQPSVAMTTCLPTVGMGCAVAAAGVGFSSFSAIIVTLAGFPYCQRVESKLGLIDTVTEKVSRYYNDVVRITDQIGRADQGIEALKKNLDQLLLELGNQAKPSIDRINSSLVRVHDALENGKEILRAKVVPKIKLYAGNRFQQMMKQAEQLVSCYNNIDHLSRSLSRDVLTSANEMLQASGKIVDAGKILDNIIRQGQAAAQAGGNYVEREWRACDDQEKVLHRDIWGVERGKFDPGKTSGHLAYLAANPNKIPALARRVTNLKAREATIPLRALEEGKKSFINLAQSKTDAGRRFDEAEALASSAARRIAKSQAKEKAKEEAARQKGASASTGPLKAVNAAPMPALNVDALKPLPMRR